MIRSYRIHCSRIISGGYYPHTEVIRAFTADDALVQFELERHMKSLSEPHKIEPVEEEDQEARG